MIAIRAILPFLLGISLSGGRTLLAQPVTADEYDEAIKEINRAQAAMDPDGFLAAFRTILKVDDARALRTAVEAYSRFAPQAQKKLSVGEFMSFHGKAAGAFGVVKSKESGAEFLKLLAKNREWLGRLLLLDASGFSKAVNLLDSSLAALRDDSPIVVRRSLQYLVRAKKPAVVRSIISRYIEVSKTKLKGADRAQWERACLIFQATLREMLQVDLGGPEDYKNYFEPRQNDPDLFHPKRGSEGGLTRVTLFGAPVTGKNIAFVLDVSGSMTSRDPLPPGSDDDRDRGKTVVGDPSREAGPRIPPEDRERMYRAKKELQNVVRSLPEDVRFNIITFASEVNAWKKGMVPATAANKKSATEYIQAMKASGITFTDAGLEEAFADLQLDTIYLLTDGAPTHVGQNVGETKPVDSDELIKEILQRVGELNFLRGVRVFTLGFQGAEEDFLKKLSADNAGSYVRIK